MVNEEDLRNIKSDIGALENEFASFKAWWIDQFTNLSHYMKVEIGVRNNKIKEQSGRITRLEKEVLGFVKRIDYIYDIKHKGDQLK